MRNIMKNVFSTPMSNSNKFFNILDLIISFPYVELWYFLFSMNMLYPVFILRY